MKTFRSKAHRMHFEETLVSENERLKKLLADAELTICFACGIPFIPKADKLYLQEQLEKIRG